MMLPLRWLGVTVQVAAKCFLIALEGCHALGWALNDLIWPNVVTSQGMWYIIDAECASRFGTSVTGIRAVEREAQVCSAATDLYALHGMLIAAELAQLVDAKVAELCELISTSAKRRATLATSLLQLPWLKSMASPPTSPGERC
jgi:hypothetical protein